MDRTIFNGLFKDLMAHIFDFAALETHPLAAALQIPSDYKLSRGHYLQQLVLDEIEQFRPEGETPSIEALEWRPYLILHQRYTEGVSSQALADYLALSKRQLRRDHSKALQALAGRLWDQVFQQALASPEKGAADSPAEGQQTFTLNLELLNLAEVLRGVRGRPGVDRGALVEVLQRVSQLVTDHGSIVEMDLNPVLAFADGGRTCVVDARIRVER